MIASWKNPGNTGLYDSTKLQTPVHLYNKHDSRGLYWRWWLFCNTGRGQRGQQRFVGGDVSLHWIMYLHWQRSIGCGCRACASAQLAFCQRPQVFVDVDKQRPTNDDFIVSSASEHLNIILLLSHNVDWTTPSFIPSSHHHVEYRTAIFLLLAYLLTYM